MMRPRALIVSCVVAAMAAGGPGLTGPAYAQSIPLPKIDNVNFFFQAGSLIGSHDLADDPSSNEKTFGELGWGFETTFDMLSTPKWEVELALGYDQMFLRSKFVNKYGLRGTIRNFPSSTIYASHTSGFYFGFGTGLVSLSNVSAFLDGQRAFTVGGDTFDLTTRLGIFKELGEKIDPNTSRASLFVELAYHARFLGSVSYGADAPRNLPGSLFFGGAVISIGAQISLKSKSKDPSQEEIKKEIKRQQRQPPPVANQPVVTTTICAGPDVPENHVAIDDYWDPTRCDRPDTVDANVWVLADLSPPRPWDSSSLPDSLEICTYVEPPKGWKVVSTRWDPTRCGQPSSIQNNVQLIKKKGGVE